MAMLNKKTRQCKYCNETFIVNVGIKKFCRSNCRDSWHYHNNKKIKTLLRARAITKVTNKTATNSWSRYSKDEIGFIKNNLDMSFLEMATELKRSFVGIRKKMRQIKKQIKLQKELNRDYGVLDEH